MADVHRVYDINTDTYKVRVSEPNAEIFSFSGPFGAKQSYDKMRQLIAEQQKKNISSKMIDHASHTG